MMFLKVVVPQQLSWRAQQRTQQTVNVFEQLSIPVSTLQLISP